MKHRFGLFLPPLLVAIIAAVVFARGVTAHRDVGAGLADLVAVPAQTARLQASFLPDYLVTPTAKVRTVATLLCGYPIGLLFVAVLVLGPTRLAIRELSARSVVVLWWWIAWLAVTAWIPFPWPRRPAQPACHIVCRDHQQRDLFPFAMRTASGSGRSDDRQPGLGAAWRRCTSRCRPTGGPWPVWVAFTNR